MAKKENKFIVAAHDLQTLAAVPRIKYTAAQTAEKKREAITLEEEKNNNSQRKERKNKHYLPLCVRTKRRRASSVCVWERVSLTLAFALCLFGYAKMV